MLYLVGSAHSYGMIVWGGNNTVHEQLAAVKKKNLRKLRIYPMDTENELIKKGDHSWSGTPLRAFYVLFSPERKINLQKNIALA